VPTKAELLVSTDWLAAHLADVRVADVRWSLLDRDKGRNAYAEGHIPGAVFLDVETDLSAPRGTGPGRHPLPDAAAFARTMARAGVNNDTHVVAYDFGDGSTAARLWWLLRRFGHARVSLLDGGFKRWTAEGRPVETSVPSYPVGGFVAGASLEDTVDADAVERLRGEALILDARAAERYEGRTEPIDPVAGHVPGAKNRPFPTNLRSADDPRFRDAETLRSEFQQLGANAEEPVVCYCGSGVNACQQLFALRLAGYDRAVLYPGSWSDWCSVPTRAVETGA
jgi:thiosulfate/3-mercaptopyruvate sulfurtransferase